MKTLYLECQMGAAGDMLMAALYELLPDGSAFLEKMNSLGIPGVEVRAEASEKCGITGTHMAVTVRGEEEDAGDEDIHEHTHGHDDGGHGHAYCDGHHPEHVHDHSHEHEAGHSHEQMHDREDGHTHDHHHAHRHASMEEIAALIRSLPVSEKVQSDALSVYRLIADAESTVHGIPVSDIHFHEVGTLDAVADVVGVCLLMEMLSPDRVIASPVHTGSGHVRCMHGILPVPAPATALLLQGIPSYGGAVQGELCTPTGAALLKHFASSFGERPVMRTAAVGYGMGKKDFRYANCLRAFFGDTEDRREAIVKLECNLDDMTGEEIGFAIDRLFDAGARDVFTVPCGMKKNRPGVLLTCIVLPEDADRIASVMMMHTSTLGIRVIRCGRYILDRSEECLDTPNGPVRVKKAEGMGTSRRKYEYEDLARIAKERGIPLRDALDRP